MIVVSAPPEESCAEQDGVIALSYFELYAQSLGIGTVWCGLVQACLKAFPELLLSYSPEVINNTISTQYFYNSSKIGFNTTHIQAKTGFGWRVADILASKRKV